FMHLHSFPTRRSSDLIEYLRQMHDVSRAIIITDRVMVDLGYVKKVTDQLNLRRNHVDIQLFCDVEPDPSIDTVYKGYELMKSFKDRKSTRLNSSHVKI